MICPKCEEYFSQFSCGVYSRAGECDCPGCLGLCECVPERPELPTPTKRIVCSVCGPIDRAEIHGEDALYDSIFNVWFDVCISSIDPHGVTVTVKDEDLPLFRERRLDIHACCDDVEIYIEDVIRCENQPELKCPRCNSMSPNFNPDALVTIEEIK